ncbi:hypothetical protein LMG29739_02168 [Paraburkholderia solisilvae]|uniref:Uncharacterized protein n=1 Tax=Paraburkholderia solisilvae TaxID=624376 RepID=A0A6J5DN74_9BURK|nr:hypothetical protein LMG29739_02168 [Paraburkholderia solisilvae]
MLSSQSAIQPIQIDMCIELVDNVPEHVCGRIGKQVLKH